MARGFESKDVEFQQAEAERRAQASPAMSVEQRERQSQRRTIELALTRARGELALTTSPVRQRALGDVVDQLSRQLEDLPVAGKG